MAIKKKVEERDEVAKVAKAKTTEKKIKTSPSKPDHILFVSANEEVVSFDITVQGTKITAPGNARGGLEPAGASGRPRRRCSTPLASLAFEPGTRRTSTTPRGSSVRRSGRRNPNASRIRRHPGPGRMSLPRPRRREGPPGTISACSCARAIIATTTRLKSCVRWGIGTGSPGRCSATTSTTARRCRGIKRQRRRWRRTGST